MPADTVRVGDRAVPLAEIEAEIAAATKGPWIVHDFDPEGGYDTLGGGHKITARAHCEIGECRVHVPNPMPYDHCPALVIVDQCNYDDYDAHVMNPRAQADATLIAHAPAYLTALVAAVRALRAQVAANHEIDEHGGCRLCTPPAVSLEDSAFPCAVRRALLGEDEAS